MTTKKKEPFTESHHQIAELAKALGHPARVAIIEYLQKSKACYCGNIVDELPFTIRSVSDLCSERRAAIKVRNILPAIKKMKLKTPIRVRIVADLRSGLVIGAKLARKQPRIRPVVARDPTLHSDVR